jgi:hypothetical protein
VEYAITLLRSFCTNPTLEAKKAVKAPIIVIKKRIGKLCSKIKEQRIIKKTPAVTRVAA